MNKRLQTRPASPAYSELSTSSFETIATQHRNSFNTTNSPRHVIYGTPPLNRKRAVHHLSELIDPDLLSVDRDYVQSPSGNLLSRAAFYAREDRPLSLRERQEMIRRTLDQNQHSFAVQGLQVKSNTVGKTAVAQPVIAKAVREISMATQPRSSFNVVDETQVEKLQPVVEKNMNNKRRFWCFC